MKIILIQKYMRCILIYVLLVQPHYLLKKVIKDLIQKGIKERVSDKFAEMVIGYAQEDYKKSKAIEHKD